MSRRAATIVLSDQERGDLEGLLRRRRTAQGLALRARIVLLASQGLDNKTIAARTGAVENTVGKWRRRFAQARVDGLFDEPRPGRPREIGDEEIAETVRLTLETTPKNATHWSLRSMAQAVGHSPSTIHRIWSAFCLQPHRTETFKLSTDPLFVEKVRDIVGLYMLRRTTRWCCALTRKAKFRPSTAASRCCRCAQARSSGARTITSATA